MRSRDPLHSRKRTSASSSRRSVVPASSSLGFPRRCRLAGSRPARSVKERLHDDRRDIALPADGRRIAEHVGDRLRGLPDHRARLRSGHRRGGPGSELAEGDERAGPGPEVLGRDRYPGSVQEIRVSHADRSSAATRTRRCSHPAMNGPRPDAVWDVLLRTVRSRQVQFRPGPSGLVTRPHQQEDNLWAALEFCLGEPRPISASTSTGHRAARSQPAAPERDEASGCRPSPSADHPGNHAQPAIASE